MNPPEPNAPAADWLVYGDALSHEGDPRGGLIVLEHAVREAKTESAQRDAANTSREYVKAHWPEIFHDRQVTAYVRWAWAFADTITLHVPEGVDALPMLNAPACARLRGLELVGMGAVDLAPTIARLAARPPPSLTELALIDPAARVATRLSARDYEPENNHVLFGDLTALWAALPGLKALTLSVADAAQLALGGLGLPNLTSFRLDCLRLGPTDYDPAPCELVAQLAEARWPALESFALRLTETYSANVPNDKGAYGSNLYEGTDDGYLQELSWSPELHPLFAMLRGTQVKRLALTGFASTGSLLEALQGELPATLEELDLSDSALSAEDLDWFQSAEGGKVVKRLKRLVVDRCCFTDADVAKLRRLGVAVSADKQRSVGPAYRFIVGME